MTALETELTTEAQRHREGQIHFLIFSVSLCLGREHKLFSNFESANRIWESIS